jgi:hypothetical protein
MGNLQRQPRLTSLAPQFLVGDLARSISYYQKIAPRTYLAKWPSS